MADLLVKSNCTFLVDSSTVLATYDNVTLEQGGCIKITGPYDFTCGTFTKAPASTPLTCSATASAYDIWVAGADAPDQISGYDGAGFTYPAASGQNMECDESQGCPTHYATNGAYGAVGANGGAGSIGISGADSPSLILNLGALTGTVSICNQPGCGGNGADGGDGGNGQAGGQGGNGGYCGAIKTYAGNGGNGGNGGDGADGQAGGNGGQGGIVTVLYEGSSDQLVATCLSSAAGAGGIGGQGGGAGAGGQGGNGEGGPSGMPGMAGTAGTSGSQGSAGQGGGAGQIAIDPPALPDSIYPVPTLPGTANADGVNAATGDVNLRFSLGSLTDGALDYELSLFYNSRSMALKGAPIGNTVGGLGWKLLDYPKIVSDTAQEGAYFFLDGNASWALTPDTAASSYTAGGSYHAWQFKYASGAWTVTNDNGLQYALGQQSTLSNGMPVWQITAYSNTAWPSSKMTFSYTGAAISSIETSLGLQLDVAYDSAGRVASVTRAASGNPSLEMVVVSYATSASGPIAAIQVEVPSPLASTENPGALSSGGYYFEYCGATDQAYPDALELVQFPAGQTKTYTYANQSGNTAAVAQYAGCVLQVDTAPQPRISFPNAMAYSFGENGYGSQGVYRIFNVVQEYRGGSYDSTFSSVASLPNGCAASYFFTGQAADDLQNYTGDADVASSPVVVGLCYSKSTAIPAYQINTNQSGKSVPVTINFSTPYQECRQIQLEFSAWSSQWSLDVVAYVCVSCFNSFGDTVASFSTELPSQNQGAFTQYLRLPMPSEVASITIAIDQISNYNGTLQGLYIWRQFDATETPAGELLSLPGPQSVQAYQVAGSGTSIYSQLLSVTESTPAVAAGAGITASSTTNYAYADGFLQSVQTTALNPSQEGAAQTVTAWQVLTRAVEAYPALAAYNVTAPVAQVVTYNSTDGKLASAAAVAGSVTQWKSWSSGGGGWAPYRKYKLQSATVGDGFASAPDGSWLLTETFLQRNGRGAVLSAQDVSATVTSKLLDTSGSLLVASFQNADVQSGEAGWLGFESYESTSGWSFKNGSVVSGQAYTGANCYSGSGVAVNTSLTLPAAQAYLVSAYVLLGTGASCSAGLYNANTNTWSARQTIAYDAANPAWRLIQCYTSAAAAGDAIMLEFTGTGSVDNIGFAPIGSLYQAVVYNQPQRQAIATVGIDGAVNRTFSDASGRLLASATPGKSLAMIQQSFSSVQGQNWFLGTPVFSADVPNQSLAVRIPDTGYWDDFTSSTCSLFPAANLSGLAVTQNQSGQSWLGLSGTEAGTGTCSAAITGSSCAVFAEIMLGAADADASSLIAVKLSGHIDNQLTSLTFGIQNGVVLVKYSGISVFSQKLAEQPQAVVLTLVVRDQEYYAYLGGTLVYQGDFSGVMTAAGVQTDWPGSGFYNFGLANQPELSNSSTDGSGAGIQFLASVSAQQSTVVQDLYNGPVRTAATLQTTVEGAALAPLSGFAALTPSTMTVSGTVNTSWPDSDAAPFSISADYVNAPVPVIASRGKGGAATAGQSGATNYVFGLENDEYFGFSTVDLLATAAKSPTGADILIYTNNDRMRFGKARIDAVTGTALLTGYAYDNALRQNATYFPLAFTSSDSVATDTYYRKMSYGFTGSVVELDDSDAGTSTYAYDGAGRGRLTQTAAGAIAATPYCAYTKYDALGRKVEQGLWNGKLSGATQSQLNSFTWPTDGTPQIQWSWDTGTSGSASTPSIGRIVAASALLPSTQYCLQQYTYDAIGAISGLSTNIQSSSSGVTTAVAQLAMTYDALGRLTAVTDTVSGYDVRYGYDELGRLSTVGNSGNSLAYASYIYGNGVVTESLLQGKVTRVYTSTAEQNLSSIKDAFFSEQLYYQSRIDGTEGYNNGQIASAAYTFTGSSAFKLPSNYSVEYVYDNFGRLTSATNSASSAWNFGSAAQPVTYDKNGNLLQSAAKDTQPNAFTYAKSSNQLASAVLGEDDVSYQYDACGRLSGCSGNDSKYAFTYDPMTSLAASGDNAGDTVQFAYDANGKKLYRDQSAGRLLYTRDAGGRVLSDYWTPKGSGSAQRLNYIYGLYGRIAMVAGEETYLLLSDHTGSPRMVLDSALQVAACYSYDPYGGMIAGLSNVGTVPLRYLYTGEEWDETLQLYTFDTRLYNQAIYRFLAPDPMHQFASPYIYSNNPVSFEDPTGEWFGLDDACAIIGGAVLGAGVELARQYIAGEEINWYNVAMVAALGAAAAEITLLTAGASLGAVTGIAGALEEGLVVAPVANNLATAACIFVKAELTSAAIGAAVSTAESLARGDKLSDVAKAAALGALGGVESGFASIVGTRVTGIAAARSLSAVHIDRYLMTNPVARIAAGAASGAITSIAVSLTHGADWSTPEPWENLVIGAASGAASAGMWYKWANPGRVAPGGLSVTAPGNQVDPGIDEMEIVLDLTVIYH